MRERSGTVVRSAKRANMRTMDALTQATDPLLATRTPLHIGAVGLHVRDLDRTAAYYRDVVGLEPVASQNGVARLGAGGVVLLELTQRRELPAEDPRTAGLYHTAFLMPTRADLARWAMHIARAGTPITGASDHGVGEAFYLDDPEGNGIEVYSDRPPQTWHWREGLVADADQALDVQDLLAGLSEEEAGFSGAPDGLRIGHVHLRVGDTELAEDFYRGAIGLDLTRRRQGASFLSSGHYHHHVAANTWHSAGAPRREPRAGLACVLAQREGCFRARRDARASRRGRRKNLAGTGWNYSRPKTPGGPGSACRRAEVRRRTGSESLPRLAAARLDPHQGNIPPPPYDEGPFDSIRIVTYDDACPRRPQIRHCPICGIAMIGDKSAPARKEPDIFRCLSCHSIVDLSGKPADESDGPRAIARDAIAAPAAGFIPGGYWLWR